jgi:hypothetical protein
MRNEKISILTIQEKATTNNIVSTEVNFYIHKNLFFPVVHLRIIALRELPVRRRRRRRRRLN